MKDMQIFNHEMFGEIRVIEHENVAYAVGVDVARALEYAKPSQAVIDHCKGIRKLGIPSYNQYGAEVIQETNCIPEGDIYRLIIKAADQSRSEKVKEKAEKFEKWIFDEILPSIRKTGTYSIEGYKTKRTSAGEVASLLKILRGVMKDQKSPPEDIAKMTDMICDQFGISLPENFVVENLNPQLMMVFIQ